MVAVADDFVRPGFEPIVDPDFPNAPSDWGREAGEAAARELGLKLTEEHWQVVCALQEFYARHDEPHINVRELHDALDEYFHPEGGIKYLYQLFPGGPIAQGCRLAGLPPPAGATDKGFGSVV
ncbi:MAG: TusE/DsrC/DsvC family sulfur relay protein [Hydrogenophilaceae bacterium]|nr:TusE/DsrC/DsvC family sulfur relay protein [Hydrogenophilaceae bacterium]